MPDPHILIANGGGYRLECLAVTDECRAYEDCLCTALQHVDPDDDHEVAEAHAVEHRWIAGGWMVPTGRCLFVDAGVADLAAEVLINGASLPAGRYLTLPSYDSDGDWFDLGFTGAGRVRVLGDLFHGRLPVPGAVYVGRQAPGFRRSPYANPYKAGSARNGGQAARDAVHAVALFRDLLESDPTLRQMARAELRGRLLACWCSPEMPCHCDPLLLVANTLEVTSCSGQR